MKYHSFDRLTSAYISSGEAHPNPGEPGEFLCPAWATLIEPPLGLPGHPFFIKGEWVMFAHDHDQVLANIVNDDATPDFKDKLLRSWLDKVFAAHCDANDFRDLPDVVANTFLTSGGQKHTTAMKLMGWLNAAQMQLEALTADIRDSKALMPSMTTYLAGLQPFLPPVPPARPVLPEEVKIVQPEVEEEKA